MPRRSALGKDRAACRAQPGIATDRFARKIGGILKASPSALAAAERPAVGPQATTPPVDRGKVTCVCIYAE
jgi:hypothetical protein